MWRLFTIDSIMLETVRALHDYTANESSCISFKKDDIIIVHEKDTSGWWDGTLDGSRGWFPSNFVVAEQISVFLYDLGE